MTANLPFTEIAGQALNGEQTAYLEGLFAGLANRGVKFTDVAPAPTSSGAVSSEDLIAEERIKRELHPLDAYFQIEENAISNKAPDKESSFRFKWNGLFWLAPTKEGYMCRLRIPGGVVKSFQLRELAAIAKELTTGYVQITTRANFQLRMIEPKNAPEFLRRIQSVGLTSRGAGADNIRNITANPTAGIDPYELIDVTPFVNQTAQYIINHREFYDLPRKFNIAFDGGGLIGSVEDTNDIGLKAVLVGAPISGSANSIATDGKADQEIGAPNALQPGVYFRVSLGGATGHKAFAQDLGVLVKPADLVKVTMALVRVFIRNGNRGNRKRARLKHLLETWSLAQYLEETEKLLGFSLARRPENIELAEHLAAAPTLPHSHVGVFPQKQSGLNYVGVAIPVGQVTPKQMLRLAEIAELYGSGEVRLTVWQNLIIPNVADTYISTVQKAVRKLGFDTVQSNLRSGFIACTGNSYCKYAASNTKGHALEFMTHLDRKIGLDQPVNVHLTGCPHSCAQHYMGDIGLLGSKAKINGESVDGYYIFVGGGFGANQAIGRQVFTALAADDTKTTLERMLKSYLKNRENGETFQQWTNRHDIGRLQEMFAEENV